MSEDLADPARCAGNLARATTLFDEALLASERARGSKEERSEAIVHARGLLLHASVELAPSRADALCIFEPRGAQWVVKSGAAVRLLALAFFHLGRLNFERMELRPSIIAVAKDNFCRAFAFDATATRRAGREFPLSSKASAVFRNAARECAIEGGWKGEQLPWPPEPEQALAR